MCWEIKSKNIPEAKVAKRDIKVIKIVWEDDLTSMFKLFPYKVGNTYCLEGELKKVTTKINRGLYQTTIDEGFHSYSTIVGTSQSRHGGIYYTKVHREVTPRLVLRRKGRLAIMECTIPMGAKYYYNPNTCEYVSDTLHVVGSRNIEIERDIFSNLE